MQTIFGSHTVNKETKLLRKNFRSHHSQILDTGDLSKQPELLEQQVTGSEMAITRHLLTRPSIWIQRRWSRTVPASPMAVGRWRFWPITPRSRRLLIFLIPFRPSLSLLHPNVPLPIPMITALTTSLRVVPVVLPLGPSFGISLALRSPQALRPRRRRPRSWRDRFSWPRRPSSTGMLLPRGGAAPTGAPITPGRSFCPRWRTRGSKPDGFSHTPTEVELSIADCPEKRETEDFTRRRAEVFASLLMIGFCLRNRFGAS